MPSWTARQRAPRPNVESVAMGYCVPQRTGEAMCLVGRAGTVDATCSRRILMMMSTMLLARHHDTNQATGEAPSRSGDAFSSYRTIPPPPCQACPGGGAAQMDTQIACVRVVCMCVCEISILGTLDRSFPTHRQILEDGGGLGCVLRASCSSRRFAAAASRLVDVAGT